MLKIYHNPKCAKSREGLNYLTVHGYEFEVIRYLDILLTAKELKTILMKLNLKPLQVVRIQDELYRRELKGKTFSDAEWIRIIVQNPGLLQRPIVESKYRAVIAVPAERIEEVV